MPYVDLELDSGLLQQKPGVGIQKPTIGIMPTIPGYDVVLWEGDLLHDKGQMFCYNPRCHCHECPLLIAQVARFVSEGLMTPDEATRFVAGHNI